MDVKGRGHGLTGLLLFHYLLGGTEEKQRNAVSIAGIRFEPVTGSRTQVRSITVFQILAYSLFIFILIFVIKESQEVTESLNRE
jgi:hypothetical protein